jgi:uncharacterized protein YcbK (DUF882 family)
MRPNDIKVAPHFKLWEFECPCCFTVRLYPVLLERLEKLRQEMGIPIVITSGYRCRKHNREVGGVERSLHLFGQAVDIAIPARIMDQVCWLARKVGFDQVIPYHSRNFIHLGVFAAKEEGNHSANQQAA